MPRLEKEPLALSDFVYDICDKNKSKRFNGLNYVCKFIQMSDARTAQAELYTLRDTLLKNIKSVLQKPSNADEFACASKLASVLGTSVQDRTFANSLSEELLPILKPTASHESPSPQNAEAALLALGALVFFCNDEYEELLEVIKICESNIEAYVTDSAKLAALKSWGILTPLLDTAELKLRFTVMMPLLAVLLKHESVDIRFEAAANLSLLKELYVETFGAKVLGNSYSSEKNYVGEQGIIVDDESDFISNLDEQPSPIDDPTLFEDDENKYGEEESWLDSLVSHFNDISFYGSAKNSRDAKENRAKFNLIHSYINDDEAPSVNIPLDKKTITSDSFVEIKRLWFAKEILGDGFASHLKTNPMMHDAFSLRDKGLGSNFRENHLVALVERVFHPRSGAKKHLKDRNKARRQRTASKEQFVSSD